MSTTVSVLGAPPAYESNSRQSANSIQTSDNQPALATLAVARPAYPIGSFFNESRKLDWPNEAPAGEGLKSKREISDQACLVVLELVEKHRSAPITTVTEARQKLVDYGQPALQVIRSLSTPRLAENFHLFMLSLYDSLAAAANPPESS